MINKVLAEEVFERLNFFHAFSDEIYSRQSVNKSLKAVKQKRNDGAERILITGTLPMSGSYERDTFDYEVGFFDDGTQCVRIDYDKVYDFKTFDELNELLLQAQEDME